MQLGSVGTNNQQPALGLKNMAEALRGNWSRPAAVTAEVRDGLVPVGRA